MAAKGLSERTGIKQKVIDEMIALARRYEVEKLILFGSRARGDYSCLLYTSFALCVKLVSVDKLLEA